MLHLAQHRVQQLVLRRVRQLALFVAQIAVATANQIAAVNQIAIVLRLAKRQCLRVQLVQLPVVMIWI